MATEIVLKVIDGKQNRNLSGIVALGRKILHDNVLHIFQFVFYVSVVLFKLRD